MPEIDDKYDPGLVAIVPGLVLETVIKHVSLSLLLLSYLVAHAHAAVLDSGERKMKSQFFISGTVVFHDVRVGRQCADEAMVVIVGNVFVDHLHDKGHLLAIDVEFHVVELKIENIPHTAVDRFVADSVLRLSLRNPGRTAIWLEAFLSPESQDLVSNLEIVVLEVLQPGKLLSSPKCCLPYHHGFALRPGMISGHPFWRGEGGGMQDWLIFAKSHGRMRSTL